MSGASEFEALLRGPKAGRDAYLEGRSAADVAGDLWRWAKWVRADQAVPEGDWRTWLVMAGRGYGKTRLGAEWLRARATVKDTRLALVGATLAEARAVMVEGESGLLAVTPPDERPNWQPSLGRLSWANGTVAQLFSAAEPDGLRGSQHHAAWGDELGKWAHGPETWSNLVLGLRLGREPRAVATTTPRPGPLLRALAAEPGTRVTGGATHLNRAHLAAGFLAEMDALYGGTRLGRQELAGELIEEAEGALWTRALIERCRGAAPAMQVRTVVGVDPPAGTSGDACGIVAVATGPDGHAHVLEDASVGATRPEGWARAVAACAARHGADRVVAEANNGGEMVASVLRAADVTLPLALVRASVGKAARAEPVALLYEAGRVSHAVPMPELEDELCGLQLGGGYAGPGRSPDRADALVWAVSELMLRAKTARPGVRGL